MESRIKNKQVQKLIKQLKSGKINIDDIPDTYTQVPEIIRAERELCLRRICQRGFDVIRQEFFVLEEIDYRNYSKIFKTSFSSFKEYYIYLEGDIYSNSCYYQYRFQDDFTNSLNLDLNKLLARKCFVTETIDDYTLELSKKEMEDYEQGERIKGLCKKWIKKFNTCKSYEELRTICNNYMKSQLAKDVDVSFFLWQYIYYDINDEERLRVIMQYMFWENKVDRNIINALCMIYNPDNVLALYKYSVGTKSNIYKQKKKLKDFVQALMNEDIESESKVYFHKKTHFFREEVTLYENKNISGLRKKNYVCTIYRDFDNFEDFIKYRNKDLSNCDLSKAIELNIDFSKYIIDNETTKLPIMLEKELEYRVFKYYLNNKFIVYQEWLNKSGKPIKNYSHDFDFFFDFVAFLKGDLSEADLLFCDGLVNLESFTGINFTNARMRSSLCKKFNILYKDFKYKKDLIVSFPTVQKNEGKRIVPMVVSGESKETLNPWVNEYGYEYGQTINYQTIYYISDLHLMHRMLNAKCISRDDVIYEIQKIINTFVSDIDNDSYNLTGDLLLIGGDTASDYSVFKIFVEILRQTLDMSRFRQKTKVVFILGNHELWDFPELNLEQKVERYRKLINENGMYLLQNDLLYKNESNDLGIISYEELCKLNEKQLTDYLRCARIVILGGIAFSGCNKKFNANQGIYRQTLNRDEELQESLKFEALYNRLRKVLKWKNTIIFTHMPMEDWYNSIAYEDDYIFISGHTHRNRYYDNGIKRIYADNQVGYSNNKPKLKRFFIDNEFNYFYDYADGIYTISGQEYNDFYRGKNIVMNYTRETYILYMLKKKGYYCFIRKSGTDGSLSILNGGALKKLKDKDIHYYYDNMDKVVTYIETSLNKYSTVQRYIADIIERIGGSGYIHGSIIDIDYNNHVYVNPYDLTITGYWASDIKNKLIYPNVPALLKAQCPDLYYKYMKTIEGNTSDPFAIKNIKKEIWSSPQLYLDTDIYKVSREIKKIQRIYSKILCEWYDNFPNDEELNEGILSIDFFEKN